MYKRLKNKQQEVSLLGRHNIGQLGSVWCDLDRALRKEDVVGSDAECVRPCLHVFQVIRARCVRGGGGNTVDENPCFGDAHPLF